MLFSESESWYKNYKEIWIILIPPKNAKIIPFLLFLHLIHRPSPFFLPHFTLDQLLTFSIAFVSLRDRAAISPSFIPNFLNFCPFAFFWPPHKVTTRARRPRKRRQNGRGKPDEAKSKGFFDGDCYGFELTEKRNKRRRWVGIENRAFADGLGVRGVINCLPIWGIGCGTLR